VKHGTSIASVARASPPQALGGVPERPRVRSGDAAAAALRVALVVAFAVFPLVAAACGDDASEEAASQTPTTVAETVDETVTETVGEQGTTTGASPPPPPPSGPVVRFSGNGDRVLPPVRVGQGGAKVVWRNDDAVFTLFSDLGLVVDSVEPGGEAGLPAGRRLLEVVASGGWRLEIQNAERMG
jgi:hypothetical protein